MQPGLRLGARGFPSFASRGPMVWGPALHHNPRNGFYQWLKNTCVCRQRASRRHQSSQSRPPPPRTRRKATRVLLIGGTIIVLGGGAVSYSLSTPSPASSLNDETFTPYTISKREAISPTSFVLTVSPQGTPVFHSHLLPDSQRWRYPLWSVEFKQPQVQIARHYTPLPALLQSGDRGDAQSASLRFYIRTVGDGEMSNYLGKLRAGQDVWLRGPHAGFDILPRLGHRTRLVFLAGGTGISPGLQAAHAVLSSSANTTVKLLWAVRKREEVEAGNRPRQRSWWEFWARKEPEQLRSQLDRPSPIGRQLEQMKATYGSRLDIEVVVDEEGSFFQDNHLGQVLTEPDRPRTAIDDVQWGGCGVHDQRLHHNLSGFEDRPPPCRCVMQGTASPGKNLFLISGPDGFISHYAGPKVWHAGQHTQGHVGGVLGRLKAQNPELSQDWLVLKL